MKRSCSVAAYGYCKFAFADFPNCVTRLPTLLPGRLLGSDRSRTLDEQLVKLLGLADSGVNQFYKYQMVVHLVSLGIALFVLPMVILFQIRNIPISNGTRKIAAWSYVTLGTLFYSVQQFNLVEHFQHYTHQEISDLPFHTF